MDETLKLILVAAIPTMGIKIVEGLFKVKDKTSDESSLMRKELMERYENCEKEKEMLRKERDAWQEKYYTLLVERRTGDK